MVSPIYGTPVGLPIHALIAGAAIFFSIALKLMPLRRLRLGIRLALSGRRAQGDGTITPFQALTTSLSATLGTGNIAGVASAIYIGGPGAVFWI